MCIIAGLFSSVCTRLGLIASLSSAVIAPTAFKSRAVVVAINHFAADTEAEIAVVKEYCESKGVKAAFSDVFIPPLYLSARIVATTTTQSGLRPAKRHLMSKNFSAPRKSGTG